MEYIGPHVEVSATSSSPDERLATLLAFREHVPVIILRKDGSVFGMLLPDVPDNAQRDEIAPDA